MIHKNANGKRRENDHVDDFQLMKLRDPIFWGQKIPKLKSLAEIPKNETETVGLDGLKKKSFGLPRFLPRALR